MRSPPRLIRRSRRQIELPRTSLRAWDSSRQGPLREGFAMPAIRLATRRVKSRGAAMICGLVSTIRRSRERRWAKHGSRRRETTIPTS